MAEYSYAALQTVEAGQNVLFNETPVAPSRCIVHRDGSGIVTLRGLTNCQCRARFRMSFGANIAIPTGGTVGAISVALAIAGEPLPSQGALLFLFRGRSCAQEDNQEIHQIYRQVCKVCQCSALFYPFPIYKQIYPIPRTFRRSLFVYSGFSSAAL